MSKIKDGGPAFPQEVRYVAPNGQTGSYGPCGGLSIRDYFAAKAMQGIICRGPQNPKDAVSISYQYADAMLAERNKQGGGE